RGATACGAGGRCPAPVVHQLPVAPLALEFIAALLYQRWIGEVPVRSIRRPFFLRFRRRGPCLLSVGQAVFIFFLQVSQVAACRCRLFFFAQSGQGQQAVLLMYHPCRARYFFQALAALVGICRGLVFSAGCGVLCRAVIRILGLRVSPGGVVHIS